jgi:outer membrane immunogenic protein
MRKVLIAAVAAFAGMSTMAHAADIYEGSLKDEPVYATAPIWSGLYVGGHIGGLWNDGGDSSAFWTRKDRCTEKCDDHWKEFKKATFDDGNEDVSLIGGLHVGYNWQDGTRVYGIEGDVSFADGLDYLASVRARLGHTVNNTLFYATAGIAFAGIEDKTIHADFKHGDTTFDVSGEKEVGLVIGGGVEHKLAPNVSIGVEGLYYLFDDANSTQDWSSSKYCKTFEYEDDNDLFVVRARLSYHLQSDEPTLDSYK